MAIVDPRLVGKPIPVISVEQMERERVARPAKAKGSGLAFLDQRLPGFQREIVNLVGMGVTEAVQDPNLAPKIAAPAHGFSLTYNRDMKKGHGAALHRHATEEVFIAMTGQWEIYWLEDETERQVVIGPGDVVSLPIGIYRGFRNATDDLTATLLAVVGGPDPGRVDWHPSVIEAARKTGLAVDDDGNLTVEEGKKS